MALNSDGQAFKEHIKIELEDPQRATMKACRDIALDIVRDAKAGQLEGAKQVVLAIEQYMTESTQDKALHGIHLLDMILKELGQINKVRALVDVITPRLPLIFCTLWDRSAREVRLHLRKLARTWEGYQFNNETIRSLDPAAMTDIKKRIADFERELGAAQAAAQAARQVAPSGSVPSVVKPTGDPRLARNTPAAKADPRVQQAVAATLQPPALLFSQTAPAVPLQQPVAIAQPLIQQPVVVQQPMAQPVHHQQQFLPSTYAQQPSAALQPPVCQPFVYVNQPSTTYMTVPVPPAQMAPLAVAGSSFVGQPQGYVPTVAVQGAAMAASVMQPVITAPGMPLAPAAVAPVVPPVTASTMHSLNLLTSLLVKGVAQPSSSSAGAESSSSELNWNNITKLNVATINSLQDASSRTRQRFMDVRFSTNMRRLAGRVRHQLWYLKEDIWLTCAGRLEDMEKNEDEEGQEDEKAAEPQTYMLEEDKDQPTCAISGEVFESDYDPDTNKWYYLDAVRLTDEQAEKYGVMPGSIVKVHCLYGETRKPTPTLPAPAKTTAQASTAVAAAPAVSAAGSATALAPAATDVKQEEAVAGVGATAVKQEEAMNEEEDKAAVEEMKAEVAELADSGHPGSDVSMQPADMTDMQAGGGTAASPVVHAALQPVDGMVNVKEESMEAAGSGMGKKRPSDSSDMADQGYESLMKKVKTEPVH